jgi:hypothetical protein
MTVGLFCLLMLSAITGCDPNAFGYSARSPNAYRAQPQPQPQQPQQSQQISGLSPGDCYGIPRGIDVVPGSQVPDELKVDCQTRQPLNPAAFQMMTAYIEAYIQQYNGAVSQQQAWEQWQQQAWEQQQWQQQQWQSQQVPQYGVQPGMSPTMDELDADEANQMNRLQQRQDDDRFHQMQLQDIHRRGIADCKKVCMQFDSGPDCYKRCDQR